jgi:hypothetical protein
MRHVLGKAVKQRLRWAASKMYCARNATTGSLNRVGLIAQQESSRGRPREIPRETI